MNTREQKLEAYGRLLDVMDELSKKNPRDREQTNESHRATNLEKTNELA